MQAYVYFDSSYAPCAFLIVRDGADPYSDDSADTTLIQTDWDWPGVATSMGWQACDCGATDGTVPCKPCGRDVSTMIGEAYDWIREHAEEPMETLADYLPEQTL